MGYGDTIFNLVFLLGVPLGFLLFFSYEAYLFIPTIARAYNYVPSSVTIRHIDFVAAYRCSLACFCDEVDDAKAQPCPALQIRSQSLSPLVCSSSPNSTTCPPTASAAVCNAGPFCCSSCNATCSSTQSPNSVCKCPCKFQCPACSCCKHVEARLCRLFCDPFYKVDAMLGFTDRHGTARSANYTYDAGSDLNDGLKFFNNHRVNSTFLGFYKPSDLSIVHLSRGYHMGKWVAFTFLSAIPFFIIAVVITGFLIWVILRRAERSPTFEVVFWANWVLWVGIIWPFLILLLILELTYPTPHAQLQLRILIPIIACIGWGPVLHRCLKGLLCF